MITNIDIAKDIVKQMNSELMSEYYDRFKPGNKILYQYTRQNNKKIIKPGTFIKIVNSKKLQGFPKCKVQLEGNKNPSRVFISDIVKF